ncbi:Hypothetical predicted protein [Podarcis lilfordi]|uniref:Uncharacterized protein n=1 Tax=Podarcis lilfordi TaxID=74358 RepID=A0AA35LL73_9SAUR|nr:Hypothetical predicted protein [Podarcis lilfordi]
MGEWLAPSSAKEPGPGLWRKWRNEDVDFEKRDLEGKWTIRRAVAEAGRRRPTALARRAVQQPPFSFRKAFLPFGSTSSLGNEQFCLRAGPEPL